jgi:hypothetical protein
VDRELPDGSVVQVPGAESLVAAAVLVRVRVRKHDFHANVQDADEVAVGV